MNYLKQIIAFDKWEELHPLSDKAYRLWLKLMAIANASGWDEWLSVPLLKLKSELHTSSDQTIMNARNSLVQAGRIEVRKGKHGKSADYRLIPFSESLSGVPNGDGSGVKSGEDSGGLHGVKGGEDSGTYYKQNKTKQNNKVLSDARDKKSISDIFTLWESNWGFPNGIARQDLTEWVNRFGTDLVLHAITFALRRNINSKGADRYLARTFERYQQEGITTVEQAEEKEKLHQQQASREYVTKTYKKPVKREVVPEWMKKDREEETNQEHQVPIQHGYVMPDDSMESIPK